MPLIQQSRSMMNIFKIPKRLAPAARPMHALSSHDILAVSGGTTGEQNPIHQPTPHPIVYVPILAPFPFQTLRPRG